MTHMLEGIAYLVIGRGRNRWEVVIRKATKKKPSLRPGELCFRVNLRVPSSLLENTPIEATLELPETAVVDRAEVSLTHAEVPDPPEIEAEVLPEEIEADEDPDR